MVSLIFFVWSNHEYGAHSRVFRSVGVNHSVEKGDLTVGVGNKWKINSSVLCFVDVANPRMVFVERINANGDNFYISLIELVFVFRRRAEFGGADRRVVGGVREEYAPAITQPCVEVNRTLRGFSGEVRCDVAQPKNNVRDCRLCGVGIGLCGLCAHN